VGQNGIVFGTGDDGGFEMHPASGGRPVPYERRDPVTPTARALAVYAGEYFSEDLNATYRVVASDSGIVLVTGTNEPMVARPLYADAFQAGGNFIQFTRRGSRVTGFEVTNGRMRRVAFEKRN
jgi:hypothetical protein